MSEVSVLTDLLRRAGAVVECDVTGGSMAAAIPDGSTVRIRWKDADAASPGSVVALLSGSASLTVHRLVYRARSRRASGWVLTRGDANVFCDPPVGPSGLVGVVDGVRVATESTWRTPPAFAARGGLRGAVCDAAAGAMRLALEIHPRAAGVCAKLFVVVMTPVVWFRPYARDRNRAASRVVPRAT